MVRKDYAVSRREPDWSMRPPRSGCKDIWNAWMIDEQTEWDVGDIPFCPTTAIGVPSNLVFYKDAVDAHRKHMQKLGSDYQVEAFLHGWGDDYKFDARRNSIWLYPEKFWTVAKHYAGFITPDFSTNIDFPDPLRRYNTYRMRAMGYWMGKRGKAVINNVRWGTADTYDIDFAGLPKNSLIAIGSVASGLRRLENRALFECGLREMAKRLEPKVVVVYGSDRYPCFEELRNQGIEIVSFPSDTNRAFQGREGHEQVA